MQLLFNVTNVLPVSQVHWQHPAVVHADEYLEQFVQSQLRFENESLSFDVLGLVMLRQAVSLMVICTSRKITFHLVLPYMMLLALICMSTVTAVVDEGNGCVYCPV